MDDESGNSENLGKNTINAQCNVATKKLEISVKVVELDAQKHR